MTKMLASVCDLEEALIAKMTKVDMIDLKQPSKGALGALPIELVREIVAALGKQCLTSATIGDLPLIPEIICPTILTMSKTGVSYIKVGFFDNNDWHKALAELSKLAQQNIQLIAVLFADTDPDLSYLPAIKNAGFKGVMLDTVFKGNGSLLRHMSDMQLKQFVQQAKELGLISGLAGSLTLEDVSLLMPYQADYLGFRSALCNHNDRTTALEVALVTQLQRTMKLSAKSKLYTQINNKVLVVDDDIITLLLLENMLNTNGYQAILVESGRRALKLMTDYRYRLALIDLNMPDLPGLELIKTLREQHSSARVVAISSNLSDTEKTELINAGFDGYLDKPVEEPYLLKLLSDANIT